VYVDSLVWQLSQLFGPCRYVLILWTVGNSVSERKTLVEKIYHKVSDGKSTFSILVLRGTTTTTEMNVTCICCVGWCIDACCWFIQNSFPL